MWLVKRHPDWFPPHIFILKVAPASTSIMFIPEEVLENREEWGDPTEQLSAALSSLRKEVHAIAQAIKGHQSAGHLSVPPPDNNLLQDS